VSKIIELDEASDEFKLIKEEWGEKAKATTIESLPGFIRELTEDYKHDYGTICHAVAIAAVAAAWAIDRSKSGGITGIQAGAVMWEFITTWQHRGNKTGLRLVDFDNMLYPQYSDDFEKTITPHVWEALQKEAQSKIKESKHKSIHGDVCLHWKSIVDGEIPFGYTVK